MRKFFTALALVLAFSASAFAADVKASKAPAFAWQSSLAVSTASPSAKYFARVAKYLAPAKLTAEQTAKLESLEKAAAQDIDSEATHQKAVAAFHNSALALLTPEQSAGLKTAHKRVAKAE